MSCMTADHNLQGTNQYTAFRYIKNLVVNMGVLIIRPFDLILVKETAKMITMVISQIMSDFIIKSSLRIGNSIIKNITSGGFCLSNLYESL